MYHCVPCYIWLLLTIYSEKIFLLVNILRLHLSFFLLTIVSFYVCVIPNSVRCLLPNFVAIFDDETIDVFIEGIHGLRLSGSCCLTGSLQICLGAFFHDLPLLGWRQKKNVCTIPKTLDVSAELKLWIDLAIEMHILFVISCVHTKNILAANFLRISPEYYLNILFFIN